MPSSESPYLEIQRMSGALYRLLGQKLELDCERLNRLAEGLANDLHGAGFRLPVRRAPVEQVATAIGQELFPAVRALPEFANVPSSTLRQRVAVTSLVLAARGYRKVLALLACVHGAHAIFGQFS
jgi:hypothetical protein